MAQIEPLTAQGERLEPVPVKAESAAVIELFDAVRTSDPTTVQRLIDRGIRVDSKDPKGDWQSPSCLEIAIANRQEEIACMLIRGGATLGAFASMQLHGVFYPGVSNELLQAAGLLLENVDQACCPVS